MTPVELAAKSNHSPLRVWLVQCSCSSSMMPLITIGASHAQQNSFFLFNKVCLRRYSIQMTKQVPPYMMRCVHLSINATSSSGVSGKKGANDSIQIKRIQKTDGGIMLVSTKPAYPPKYFSAKEQKETVTIIGRVMEIRTRF